MSCSMTVDQVRDRTKTETRRAWWTWKDLQPGEHLLLIEKGMGLPKGAKQVVLAEVEVVGNDSVRMCDISPAEVAAEGFPHMTPDEFVAFWMRGHGLRFGYGDGGVLRTFVVRRISWRYVDDQGR
jgi:hypothetical protein